MAQQHETDYLIVGAGVVGLAFADTRLDETDAHVTLVDRHAKPMSDYRGNGTLVSLLSGQETQLKIRRKTVDATFIGTAVPSTHTPKYPIAAGVRVIAPNELPQWWQGRHQRPLNYVIVGAGKTAIDAGVWLLNSGAAPQSIHWVIPRDSCRNTLHRLHRLGGREAQ